MHHLQSTVPATGYTHAPPCEPLYLHLSELLERLRRLAESKVCSERTTAINQVLWLDPGSKRQTYFKIIRSAHHVKTKQFMASYTSYSWLFTIIISCNFQYRSSDGLGSENATLAPPLGLRWYYPKGISPKGIVPVGIAMLYPTYIVWA